MQAKAQATENNKEAAFQFDFFNCYDFDLGNKVMKKQVSLFVYTAVGQASPLVVIYEDK